MSKVVVKVALCEACRAKCAAELVRRGLPAKGAAPLDVQTSHALVKLLCERCLEGGGIRRTGAV